MMCWFCSVRAAEDLKTYKIDLYGDVDTRQSDSQTQVAYRVQRINVPRCGDCYDRHRMADATGILAIILIIILPVAILLAYLQILSPWIWTAVAGLALGLALGSLLSRAIALKNILSPAQARKTYPAIVELLDKGYRFGRRPKDALLEKPGEGDKDNQNIPPVA